MAKAAVPSSADASAAGSSSPGHGKILGTTLAPGDERSKRAYDFFWWHLNPLLDLGMQRPLQMEDLGPPLASDMCDGMASRIMANVATQADSRPLSLRLLVALAMTERSNLLISGACKVVGDLLGFIGPLALSGIVDGVETISAGSPSPSYGGLALIYWWMLAAFASALLQNFLLQHHHQLVIRSGIRARGAIAYLSFRKALTAAAADPGAVQNHAGVDANNVNLAFWYVHYAYAAPLQLAICMAMLVAALGPSAFVGLAVLVAMVPPQLWAAARSAQYARAALLHTDKRMRAVAELLSSILLLKLFVWEGGLTEQIKAARSLELRQKRLSALVSAINFAFLTAGPLVMAILTFLCFGLISNSPLTPSVAFSSLTLFSILRLPLMVAPMLVSAASAGWVSLSRVAAFLEAPEVRDFREVTEVALGEGAQEGGSRGGDAVGSSGATGLRSAAAGATGATEGGGGAAVVVSVGGATAAAPESCLAVPGGGALAAAASSHVFFSGPLAVHVDVRSASFAYGDGAAVSSSGSTGAGGGALPKAAAAVPPEARSSTAATSASVTPAAAPQAPVAPSPPGEDLSLGATHAAPAAAPRFQLTDINLYIPRGRLTMVVGAVASGKTTLLRVLLGGGGGLMMLPGGGSVKFNLLPLSEWGIVAAASAAAAAAGAGVPASEEVAAAAHLPPTAPRQHDTPSAPAPSTPSSPPVAPHPRVAYCPSSPWLLNDTVRANITLGCPFDAARYARTVSACALEADFNNLRDGDASVCGDNGVVLSGGQKARVALARAVYSNAPILLLDDPISAVDATVGRRIFHDCILQRLVREEGRTVVLVTHAVQLVPLAQHLVVMNRGAIVQQGPPRELVAASAAAAAVAQEAAAPGLAGAATTSGGGGGCAAKDPALVSPAAAPDLDLTVLHRLLSAFSAAASAGGAAEASGGAAGAGNEPDPIPAATGSSPIRSADPIPVAAVTPTHSPTSSEWGPGAPAAAGAEPITDAPLPAVGDATAAGANGADSDVTAFPLESAADGGGATPSQTPLSSTSPPPLPGALSSEERLTGRVPLGVYTQYLGLFGSCLGPGMAITLVLSALAATAPDVWLSFWASGTLPLSLPTTIGVYAALTVSACLLLLLYAVAWAYGGIRAAGSLHSRMLSGVVAAPMAFFDTTPAGRVVNRFAGDVSTVDGLFPQSFQAVLSSVSKLVVTVLLVAIILPYSLVGLALAGIFFVYLTNTYRSSARELKRLDSISKSPVSALISEVLVGREVVRAFSLAPVFAAEFAGRVDANSHAYITFNLLNRWFGVRMDSAGALVVGAVCLVAALTADTAQAGLASPSLIGLAISYALSITQLLNWTARQFSDTETYASSLERVQFYAQHLPVEGVAGGKGAGARADGAAKASAASDRGSEGGAAVGDSSAESASEGPASAASAPTETELRSAVVKKTMTMTAQANLPPPPSAARHHLVPHLLPTPPLPPHSWPSGGTVTLSHVSARYRPDTPIILRDVSLTIPGGTRLAIVGRTGSGKSSLSLLLFRMFEAESGCLCIDGVDTASLPLPTLRRALTIIPQDPVLFSGTVRGNLDPGGMPAPQHGSGPHVPSTTPAPAFSDAELWAALDRVQLRGAVEHGGGLDAAVEAGGANFSSGQRQLLCVARALLRKPRILIVDEATANADPHADALIQGMLRSDFAGCTMITIAHRLNTIRDYDEVVVMEGGRVAEVGSPAQLLLRHGGAFARLLESSEAWALGHAQEAQGKAV